MSSWVRSLDQTELRGNPTPENAESSSSTELRSSVSEVEPLANIVAGQSIVRMYLFPNFLTLNDPLA